MNATLENLQKNMGQLLVPIRGLLFGKQNERIEFLMDSYYKLAPEARSGVVAGGILGGVLLIVLIVSLYIIALGSLQNKLDGAFEATNQIRELRQSHASVKSQFAALEAKLDAASTGLSLMGVLETKAKELGIQTRGFPPQVPTSEFPDGNPLAKRFQQAKVEFKVQNASLRKIMDYVIAIEALPNMLRVTSLRIKALYQNKLFFDATLEVEAVVQKS